MVYNTEQMRLEISKGYGVWLDEVDQEIISEIKLKSYLAKDDLDQEKFNRIKRLLNKNVLQRKNKDGHVIYEIRRGFTW